VISEKEGGLIECNFLVHLIYFVVHYYHFPRTLTGSNLLLILPMSARKMDIIKLLQEETSPTWYCCRALVIGAHVSSVPSTTKYVNEGKQGTRVT
jgi:hypothetical protein